jgi:prepilin-type N-terminal cleavage/methylation domain-containing protein
MNISRTTLDVVTGSAPAPGAVRRAPRRTFLAGSIALAGSAAEVNAGGGVDCARGGRAPQDAAFTLIEIAISLAVIGIALVAIIGVLPLGMNVQKENREATVINQDATVFLEAISKGARGLNDLTNYVYAITNNWVLFNASGGVIGSGVNGYSFSSSSASGTPYVPASPIWNGTNIVGLLSTPQFIYVNGAIFFPTNNLFSGGYSNHIIAYVRSISGAATEKPPQDNQIIRGGPNDSGDSFAYRILCVNAAMAQDTNLFFNPPVQSAYNRQLAANLHELRLTFFWPIQPNGKVGTGRQSYRTLIAGQLMPDTFAGNGLYFYQSQSFTNAP